MTMQRRARPISGIHARPTYVSVVYDRGGAPLILEQNLAPVIAMHGDQVTDSEGHPFKKARKSRFIEDIGGPFFTRKRYVSRMNRKPYRLRVENAVGELGNFRRETYNGPVLPFKPFISVAGKLQVDFPPPMSSSENDLNMHGATAIARCKPTNGSADLSTALGEIVKEGLPSILGASTWRDRALTAKNAGSDYLSYQFGWAPLIGEISSFTDFISRSDDILRQYERDAGKMVRRKYHFPVESSTSEAAMSESHPPQILTGANSFYKAGMGKCIRRRTVERNRWFSGAFTYHLPTGYDSRNELDKLALKAKLLGVEITPETVWNLAPWTWAADWFSNTGDVLSNVSDVANQGLILRYGYMMEHTIVTDTYIHSGAVPANNSMGVPREVADLVLVTETKTRQQANPFGFGISWESLSPFRLSILAALGITRR